MPLLRFALTPSFIAAYLGLAFLVGLSGRNKQIGFWGFFLLSILITPLITGFFMIICRPRKPKTVIVRQITPTASTK